MRMKAMKRSLVLAGVLGAFGAGLTFDAAAKDIEVVAVYYPHWHKYPKGDEWFGKKWNWDLGEWAFVKDPVTRFPGQINFKPWVGYLDGSKPEDVETEIALAHNSGIDVFLYDYYWYNGQKTQEEAIEKGFFGAKNRGLMKFALMWCYHERKNAWRKGYLEEVSDVMNLAHTPEEFLCFIDYSITHYFNQSEYWRYKGGLFFSIYNFKYLWETWGKDDEKIKRAFAEARRRVRAAGLGELHLNAQGVWPGLAAKFAALGLDSITDYGYNAYCVKDHVKRFAAGEKLFDFGEIDGRLQDHWKEMREKSPVPYIPVVPTGWDATLRCAKNAKFPWGEKVDYPYCATFTNATDRLFEKYLRDAKAAALADPKKPGAVYINAWNEYTEGCWLLPDSRRHDLKLRAIARVFGRQPANEYVYTTGLKTWEGPKAKNGRLCKTETPAVENVKYGPHERQGIDVWFPAKAKAGSGKTPAVVVIHGGGWSYGDKLSAGASWLKRCRDAGYALISVSYRFIQDGNDANIKPPVRAPLDDAIAALRFIRAHADEWNVDVTRLGLTGGSAGACSSLYASLQNDCEFGIRAVFTESPQTSLDPKETRAWIPNATYGCWAFGYGSFDKWIENFEESRPWIEKFSPAGLLRKCTAAKAPAFFYSCGAMPKPGELAKDPTHSPVFCAKFQEIAEAKGVRCRRGSSADFLNALK